MTRQSEKMRFWGWKGDEVAWNALELPFSYRGQPGIVLLIPFTNEERSFMDVVVLVNYRTRFVFAETRVNIGDLESFVQSLTEDPFGTLPALKLALDQYSYGSPLESALS